MKQRFTVTFKRGITTVATVDSIIERDSASMTLEELEQVIPTEQFLERLTGLRVHIECTPVDSLEQKLKRVGIVRG